MADDGNPAQAAPPEIRPALGPANRTEQQILIFAVAVLGLIGLLVVLPSVVPLRQAPTGQLVHARIVSLVAPSSGSVPSPTPASPASGAAPQPRQAVVHFLDGPYAGLDGQGDIQGPSGSLELPDYRPGDEVVAQIDTLPDGTRTMVVVDRWRLPLFGWLLAAFAAAAIAVAGWRGLRAIVSLALTLILVLRLFVPLVLAGWDPVLLAIAFGIVVTTLSFLLTQGLNRATLSAVAGTTFGLAVTGLLAAVVNAAARFTPAQGSDHIVYLSQLAQGSVNLSGLLLAAVIFGGLGVLNDVAISQAVTVEELHDVDPGLSRWQLFTRTMNIGTAHLAATVNTLVFAYLGTALPLVVLLLLEGSNLTAAISGEDIAVEIVRTVVGAIGVVAAVPITTAIACRWVVRGSGRPPVVRAARPAAAPMRVQQAHPESPPTDGD